MKLRGAPHWPIAQHAGQDRPLQGVMAVRKRCRRVAVSQVNDLILAAISGAYLKPINAVTHCLGPLVSLSIPHQRIVSTLTKSPRYANVNANVSADAILSSQCNSGNVSAMLDAATFTKICDSVADGVVPPLACSLHGASVKDFLRYRRAFPECEEEYALALECLGEIMSADNTTLHETLANTKVLSTVIDARSEYLRTQLPDKFAPRSNKTVTHKVDADNLASALESAMLRLPHRDQQQQVTSQVIDITPTLIDVPADRQSATLPDNVDFSAEKLFDETGGTPPPTPRFRG